MFTVGLTGGIASGKSAVADLFRAHGAAVVDTDLVAREVVAVGQPGLAAVADAFGDDVLTAAGELDRSALRARIFSDPTQKARLDALLHPLIRTRTVELMAAAEGTAPYMLVVVPLLVETGFDELVHRVLVVDCPQQVQVERLLARDGVGVADADKALAAQASRAERLARADDVIVNAGSREDLAKAVDALHERYLAAAAYPNP